MDLLRSDRLIVGWMLSTAVLGIFPSARVVELLSTEHYSSVVKASPAVAAILRDSHDHPHRPHIY